MDLCTAFLFLISRVLSPLKSEQYEIANIENQAKSYFIEVDKFCPRNTQELRDVLESRRGIEYDYVYLSSHGDEWGFANDDDSLNIDWVEFGDMLCDVACMKKDCVVMLSCCRGGLNQVVYKLFFTCYKIGYIIGPRQNLDAKEMAISFSLFLFNREFRDLDPVVACEKIKCGTDIRFMCFDSLETRGEAAYVHFEKMYDAGDGDEKLK